MAELSIDDGDEIYRKISFLEELIAKDEIKEIPADKVKDLIQNFYRVLELANGLKGELQSERSEKMQLNGLFQHNLRVIDAMKRVFKMIEMDKMRVVQKLNAASSIVAQMRRPFWRGKMFRSAERMWDISKDVDRKFKNTNYHDLVEKIADDMAQELFKNAEEKS